MRLATLVALEGRKALRQPSTWTMGLILVGVVVLVGFSFATLLGAPPTPGLDAEPLLALLRADAVGFCASLFGGVASIVLVVFAALLVGQEFSRATLRTLLLNRVTRGKLAAAKYAFVVLVAALLALIGALAALALAATLGAAAGEDLLGVGERGAPALVADLAWRAFGLFVALSVWGATAFAITLPTKSVGAGIGGALASLVVADPIIDPIARAGPVGLFATRVLPHPALAELGGATPPGWGEWVWVIPVVLSYGVGLPALAAWRFRRVDALAATK